MAILWVLLNYPQTILENLMISRIAHLSLATLISVAIGISPISVMAADPASTTPPAAAPATAPTATPTDKAAEKKVKKEKRAEKKSKKKSKKKAKPAVDASTL
jgi:hypothetical protein